MENNVSSALAESGSGSVSESTESQESSQSLESASPEVTEQAQAIKNSGAPKAEIKKALKTLKLKVDGKEQSVEFDPNDDEFMTRELQKSRAFEKRAQDFSQLEKEVKTFIEELRKNPKKVLSDPNIGLDMKKLAAEVIEEEIANSQKSPEQLEREKLQNELKELKEQREKEKEADQKKEFDRIQEREFERYDTLMTQSLEKSDLPKSPYVVKKMADLLIMGLQAGVDVTPDDVLPLVREEIQNDLKQMFAVMPDEVIEKIVGKDIFTRIRKKNIAKTKAAPASLNSSIKDTGMVGKPADKSSGKKMTFKEFFKA